MCAYLTRNVEIIRYYEKFFKAFEKKEVAKQMIRIVANVHWALVYTRLDTVMSNSSVVRVWHKSICSDSGYSSPTAEG